MSNRTSQKAFFYNWICKQLSDTIDFFLITLAYVESHLPKQKTCTVLKSKFKQRNEDGGQ